MADEKSGYFDGTDVLYAKLSVDKQSDTNHKNVYEMVLNLLHIISDTVTTLQISYNITELRILKC
jgi:hypothetical protein